MTLYQLSVPNTCLLFFFSPFFTSSSATICAPFMNFTSPVSNSGERTLSLAEYLNRKCKFHFPLAEDFTVSFAFKTSATERKVKEKTIIWIKNVFFIHSPLRFDDILLMTYFFNGLSSSLVIILGVVLFYIKPYTSLEIQDLCKQYNL